MRPAARSLFASILILGLAACAVIAPPNPTATTPPDTPTPSDTAAPSAVPLTVTARLTPRPTLPLDELPGFFQDLVQNNGGCELPCFDGGRFIVGKTSTDDTMALLRSMGKDFDRYDNSIGSDVIPRSSDGSQTGYYNAHLTFSFAHDVTRQIEFVGSTWDVSNPGFTSDWQLRYGWDQILEQNGQPSEIRALFLRGGAGVEPYYGLSLLYEKAGMVITYQGPARVTDDSKIEACLRFDQVNRIYLRLAPDTSPDGIDLGPRPTPPGLVVISSPQTLYEQTGLSPEQFYEIFRKRDAVKCVTSEITHLEWPATNTP